MLKWLGEAPLRVLLSIGFLLGILVGLTSIAPMLVFLLVILLGTAASVICILQYIVGKM